jgi:mannose-6-phosphate isomerase-like protein (cupin superfamily)
VQIEKGSKSPPETQPVYRGPMADYRIAVAVYEPMAVADYPFPPRPKRLESLDDGPNSEHRLIGKIDSRSVGADGHGAVRTTLTSKGVQFELYAVAPGAITMTVNGRTVDVARFWTWEGSGYGGLVLKAGALRALGIDVAVGDRITVGVAARQFTDPAWRAEVREGP